MIKIVRLKNFNAKTLAEVNRLLTQMGLTSVQPRALTPKVFKGLLSQDNVYLLVAKSGDVGDQKLAGMLVLYFVRVPSGLYALLEDLVVDGPYRKWGAGRLLVEEAVKLARSKKARHISLRTNPVRLEANALYEALGFKLMKTNFYRINLFK